ncbi:MAG: TonB-dependent receptor [Bacteroidales bacterium]|jgi:outer membrane receptor protein involved in Fe transport|nr:TonB-dependent receptor [Bacteroidales bacterium]
MNKKSSYYILMICSLFLLSKQAQAQTKATENPIGVISGTITDEDDKPLDYVTVAALKPSDSSLVAGSISDEKGKIKIDKLPLGTYLLRITYIGYKPIFLSNIVLTAEKPTYSFGKQQFKTTATKLEGVTIAAEKEMIQNNLDKRVFNVDKDIVTTGATGEDVLSNIPSVSVDLDGNVSLRGSESVTILVNGRPTNLTMSEIPAESIEKIEVVTNPSAKYDPDGVSGIINVVLKKEKKLGLNASVSLGTGITNYKKNFYFGNYSASASLNFMYNKVNFYVSYNFRRFSMHHFSDLERDNVFNNDTTFLTQTGTGNSSGMPQNVRAGLDYFINDANTISFDFSFRRRGFGNKSEINYLTTKQLYDTVSYYDQISEVPVIGSNSWSGGFNYSYTSQKVKGQTLSIDLSFSQSDRNNQNNMEQIFYYPTNRHFVQKSITDAANYRGTAQLDFVTPIGNGGRLETGYKFNYQMDKDDYRYFVGEDLTQLVSDSTRDNSSKYIQYINAVYLIYSNSIRTKFKYQVGLRAELANIQSQLATESEDYIPKPYFNVFPTVHLRYDFNDIHSIQFGYSMRVGRPRGPQLNPYLNDADKLNLSQGNRKLKPEFTQSFDLGYLFMKNKTSLSASIFYRYRYDIISRYTILINDSTTLTTYQNLNNSHSYGLELSYQQDIFKFWKLSLTGSLYQMFVNADSLYDNTLANNVTAQLRLNNNFELKYDIQIQLSAYYRSPTLTLNSMGFESGGAGQGTMAATWGMDFGFKKSFFKKALSISLRVSDIFGTNQVSVESFGTTSNSSFYSKMYRYRDSRQFWITVSYQLVNYKTKRKIRTIDDPADDYEQ